MAVQKYLFFYSLGPVGAHWYQPRYLHLLQVCLQGPDTGILLCLPSQLCRTSVSGPDSVILWDEGQGRLHL